jgi:ubiquinol-cytochrome c reductase cytochrome b subunit
LSNSLVTPAHIVPEWYFLPLYAILRSIPSKLLGVVALFFGLLIILVLPFIAGRNNIIRSFFFKPLVKFLIVFIIFNSIILGWIGGQSVVPPYYFIGQIATFMYYLLFLSFIFIGFFEQIISKIYSKKSVFSI